MKALRRIIYIISSLILISVFSSWIVMNSWMSPSERLVEAKLFSIESGDSLSVIAQRLEENGIIKSALSMRLVSMFQGTEGSFQKGSYRIVPGSTLLQIHNDLTQGKQFLIRVSIPEGWPISKIARKLEELDLFTAEEFILEAKKPEYLREYMDYTHIPTLEGFLFPDTYMVPPNITVAAMIHLMVQGFFNNILNSGYIVLEQLQDPAAVKAFYEKVILASIVEREYRIKEEAPLIASVFQNRLKSRIGLGSCATIEYIITEVQGRPHPKRILISDTQIRSPYNTYLYWGLPPTPISNSGKIALDAVFHPVKSNYYYFVLNNPAKGTHTFSRNLDDHNSAKGDYLSQFTAKQ